MIITGTSKPASGRWLIAHSYQLHPVIEVDVWGGRFKSIFRDGLSTGLGEEWVQEAAYLYQYRISRLQIEHIEYFLANNAFANLRPVTSFCPPDFWQGIGNHQVFQG